MPRAASLALGPISVIETWRVTFVVSPWSVSVTSLVWWIVVLTLRGGPPRDARKTRGSAPSPERLDHPLDSSLACLRGPRGLDVVDVLATEPEGKPVEGGTGRRGCVERDLQVGRLVHLARV